MFSAAVALRSPLRAVDTMKRAIRMEVRKSFQSQGHFLFLHHALEIRTLLSALTQLALFIVSMGHFLKSVVPLEQLESCQKFSYIVYLR